MANSLRLACMVVTILGVALTAALFQPEWAEDLHLEAWRGVILANQGLGPQAMPIEIARCQQAIHRRTETKQRIAADLIDGRITLFEAAALFRHLNEMRPRVIDPYTPGASEEERLCRQVIQWVRRRLKEHCPDSVDQFAAPFEEELRRHKERYGRVILPDALRMEYLSEYQSDGLSPPSSP